ncbi:hypothetical protein JCM11491_006135 [Sporobolomyces phaffii]
MSHMNVLERPARSQFLKKLHRLLENPTAPESLRWTSAITFEIAIEDDLAIAALQPEFEFRSLGSFVRQLSYYNFKRLSDRRRSSERGTAKKGFIRFTHQSGYFTRGDASQISRITRRPRTNRPRRPSVAASNASNVSGGSDEREASYPAVAWATQDAATSYFSGDGPEAHPASNSLGQAYPTYTPVPGDRPAPDFANKWRNYSPATAGFTTATPSVAGSPERQRRASMPTFNYLSNGQSQSGGGAPHAAVSPNSAPPSYIPLPSLSEGRVMEARPSHRSAYSTTSIPTIARLPEIPSPTLMHQQPPRGGSNGFRASEYPTPSFDSSTNVFFTQPTFIPPAPRGATNLPAARPFLSELKFDPSFYAQSSNGHPCSSPPVPTLPSPSEQGSSPRPVSPTNDLQPSSSCSLGPSASPPLHYYSHYSPNPNEQTTEYAGGRGGAHPHQPRQMPQSQPEAPGSYFPSVYQHASATFSSPWSPGLSQNS